jgi:hypothetical protein
VRRSGSPAFTLLPIRPRIGAADAADVHIMRGQKAGTVTVSPEPVHIHHGLAMAEVASDRQRAHAVLAKAAMTIDREC